MRLALGVLLVAVTNGEALSARVGEISTLVVLHVARALECGTETDITCVVNEEAAAAGGDGDSGDTTEGASEGLEVGSRSTI
jgi:hypothetical protein